MCWVMPLCVGVVWLVDSLLIVLYNWCVHPWIAIVTQDKNGDRERISKEAKALIAKNTTHMQAK